MSLAAQILIVSSVIYVIGILLCPIVLIAIDRDLRKSLDSSNPVPSIDRETDAKRRERIDNARLGLTLVSFGWPFFLALTLTSFVYRWIQSIPLRIASWGSKLVESALRRDNDRRT